MADDDIILSDLSDDELVLQMHDDLYDGPFRMPVQWVNRPNLNFRGFSGRIVGGSIKPGDPIRVLPSGTTSTVDRIVTMDGDLDEAIAGQSVTITLADEIDASRGDIIQLCAYQRGHGREDQVFEGHHRDAAARVLAHRDQICE